MANIHYDGKAYVTEVSHPGLNTYRVIRGRTQWEVEQAAAAQIARWNESWNKKQASARQAEEKEQKRTAARMQAEEKERKKEKAGQLSVEVAAVITELKHILLDTLPHDDTFDWRLLLDQSNFTKPKPNIPKPVVPAPPVLVLGKIPPQPMITDPRYQVSTGFIGSILPAQRAKAQDAANQQFQRDLATWARTKETIDNQNTLLRQRYEAAARQWEQNKRYVEQQWYNAVASAERQWNLEREAFEQQKVSRNAQVSTVREGYLAHAKLAVEFYCDLVLKQSTYPQCLPKSDYQLQYNPESKLLVIDFRLPAPHDLPNVKEVRYVQSRDAFEDVPMKAPEFNALYDSVIYQITLRTIHEMFEADAAGALDMVAFNGIVESTDKSTGQTVQACVLSVQTTKPVFQAIDLARIEPKACFKQLRGVGSSQLHSLTPIAPIVRMDRADSRFVEARVVSDGLDEGVNLAAMDWEDFEHLIRELFETEFSQSGGEVRVTRASRDGGVDAVIFDPDPIRGGKIVVQAKRYTNTVGVSAVRDLYGTVMNEGATKGILVTTADYGPDAYEFAKGKPLTLLNGGNLLHLLEKHGHRARINLAEARSEMLLRNGNAS